MYILHQILGCIVSILHFFWTNLHVMVVLVIRPLVFLEDLRSQWRHNIYLLYNLTIIELTMWPCVWPCVRQPTPKTADVTVTKIAGYVRVRILMNLWFFRIFGIHSFYGTATLLNIWICMQWTDAADGGCGGGLDFASMHAIHRYTRPN